MDLKQIVAELRLPSSKDRMSLLMPSDLALPVVAHVEASTDLASIPMVREIYLGCHRIEMLNFPLS